MKAKRIIAALLGTVVCLSALTACGGNSQNDQSSQSGQSAMTEESKTPESSTEESTENQEEKTEQKNADSTSMHKLYIKDAGKNDKIVATFFNSTSGASEDVTMEKQSGSADDSVFTCEADTEKYNMVRLSYGDMTSMEVAFNKFVSGWYLWEDELLPYVVGTEPKYEPAYETKTFTFDDYDKNVYIWTPQDYDKKSEDKYSVIYMLDGQTCLTPDIGGEVQCWDVSEHATSMMAVTDHKAIIVAIETVGGESDKNSGTRDDELIPDLGTITDPDASSKKKCKLFADFICDTVMPYIDSTYNVYTDAANTSICGSSYGGLASFYIGMEHPDQFGTIGALSPSFWTFDEDTWKKYLSEKKFGENSPFIYFYSGSYAEDTGLPAASMNNYLAGEGNYPKDKFVFNKNEKGQHSVPYWRNVYPEFLEAMFTGKVSALESGVKIDYKDKTVDVPETNQLTEEELAKLKEADDYLYYDNSETKWEKVYAYWWGNLATNKATGEDYMKEWPGYEMERISDSDIYRIVVPVGPTGFIFDSGVTDDDVKKGVTAYQTGDLAYRAVDCAGKIYKIDMTEEPEKGRGVEKTKYRYMKGEWSEYKAS